jgi:hypothetical protein
MIKKFRILVAAPGLLCLMAWAQPIVVHPIPQSADDRRYDYPIALLTLCAKQSRAFRLEPTAFRAPQGRYLRMVENRQGLDVAVGLIDQQREEQFLPVRVPIDRGLFGWRLLLIDKNKQNVFDKIQNIDDLSKYTAGLGHDWPDVDIFKNNQLQVSTSSSYEGLFQMLARQHVDYFPRAVVEVWPEQAANAHLNIAVEQQLVVHYPTAAYFFVHKHNHFLADTLTRCLTQAVDDGSFNQLFKQHFGEAIAKSNLGGRKVIHLQNPLLPASTPLNESKFWFSPEEDLE